MSEQRQSYTALIAPTEAELNLIARLRQLRGVVVIDLEGGKLYGGCKPEYLAGRNGGRLSPPDLPFAMDS